MREKVHNKQNDKHDKHQHTTLTQRCLLRPYIIWLRRRNNARSTSRFFFNFKDLYLKKQKEVFVLGSLGKRKYRFSTKERLKRLANLWSNVYRCGMRIPRPGFNILRVCHITDADREKVG